MGMTIKVPVKDLQKEDTCAKVRGYLANDPDNAYTISGLIVRIFGIKEGDIHNKPFRDWPKGMPSLYTRIRLCLNKLINDGEVKVIKHGKAWVYHWTGRKGDLTKGRIMLRE